MPAPRQRRHVSCFLARHALAAAAIALVGACTTVQVSGGRPAPRLWAFAPIQIRAESTAPVLLVTSRGFGLSPGLHGVTLGYRSETWAAVSDPDSCRVIFFSAPEPLVHDPVAQLLARELKEGELCLVTRGRSPGP